MKHEGRVAINLTGNEVVAAEYISQAKSLLGTMKEHIAFNGIPALEWKREYSDHRIIVIANQGEYLIHIDGFNPPVKKPTIFQCDLYQDDPESPGDIEQQIKTSIAFSVKDEVFSFDIPERQGNMEWQGIDRIVSWDSVQNWGRTIVNKKAWNDAIIAAHDEGIGWPYNPRPAHAVRNGEITTIIDHYPASNTTLSERILEDCSFRAVFESPGQDYVYKQLVFIDGIKKEFVGLGNQKVMGACTGRSPNNNKEWGVLITQEFLTLADEGVIWPEEYVYYFDPEEEVPTLTEIAVIEYQEKDPSYEIYRSSKSHLTPWAFTPDGTKGKALRSEQYHLRTWFLDWGAYIDMRWADLVITYEDESVSCTWELDTSVIPEASEVNGSNLTPGQVTEYNDALTAWNEALYAELGFPPQYFGIDIGWKEGVLKGIATKKNYSETQTGDEDNGFENHHCYFSIYQAGLEAWAASYKGTIRNSTTDVTDGQMNSKRLTATDLVGMFYIGGDPSYDIAFFIKKTVSGTLFCDQTIAPPPTDRSFDSPNEVTLQVVCLFKGATVYIGSPIVYLIPERLDLDDFNSSNEAFPLIDDYQNILTDEEKDDAYNKTTPGMASPYLFPSAAGYSRFSHTTHAPTGVVTGGEFGGSIKCAPDGTHCVISCSYMDVAKYLYPWHRYSADVNAATTVDRWDTLTKLNVDQAQQDAWNKYMLNYAIIDTTEDKIEEGDTTFSVYQGDSGSTPNNQAFGTIGDGSSSDLTGSATGVYEKFNENIVVEQLSSLLFNKEVKTEADPLTGEFAFGIEDQDTTVYLPIGLYGQEAA